ncbi:MAG TPA: thiamine pyrophosphate-binding protein, partial [Solirubrobacterales bacterium]
MAASILRLARAHGIDTFFGIPGVHTLEYYRALAGSGLRVVTARHEQGAAFMADGYARATGKPAAVCVITGPGLTNAATAIAQARSDSVPMLVLTAINPIAERERGRLHEMRSQELVAAGLSDLAFTVRAAGEVGEVLAVSFAALSMGRPQPAIVTVPLDVLPAAATAGALPAPPRPVVQTDAVAEAASTLAAARRPALILGGGAAEAAPTLRRIAERLQAPTLTTIAGKGIVPESSPLSLGATLPLAETRDWLAGRDVVLAIGTELAATDTEIDEPVFEGTMIRVDLDPARLDDGHRAAIPVHADAGEFAEALLEEIPRAGRSQTSGDRPAAGRAPWVRDSHLTALAALRAHTSPETRFYSDMTQLAYTGNIHFPVELPRRWLHPVGFGSLGFGLPAAIGGALGDPEAPVVAL